MKKSKTNYLQFVLPCFLSILLLTSCSQQPYQQQFYVFGTLVTITVWGQSETKAQEAINAVVQKFQTFHNNWHAWRPSQVTELNQAIAKKQPYQVQDAQLLTLLTESKKFSQLSEGLFNPAIGQLIHLWGFHNDEITVTQPPAADAIARLVALVPTMEDLDIQNNQVSSHHSAIQLDLGAIAKGYAVDLAIEELRSLGIENAIVNAGGNLKAIGQKGNMPWLIGIRHPSGTGVLAAVAINGEESVITSGSYERFFDYQGIRYSHLLDPRTGNPIRGLTSVTIIDRNAALADAASTALAVAGLKDWHRIAKKMGIRYALLVDEAGTVYMNSAMAKRVHFDSNQKPKIVISEEPL